MEAIHDLLIVKTAFAPVRANSATRDESKAMPRGRSAIILMPHQHMVLRAVRSTFMSKLSNHTICEASLEGNVDTTGSKVMAPER